MKNAWSLGFLSRCQGLSCPLLFSFRWRFCSSLLCSDFRRNRSSNCSSNSRWCCWRGFRRHGSCSSFVETDFFGLLSESSMDLAFTSSRSSVKNLLQTPPKVVKTSHTGIFWGSLDFINDPFKPTEGP